MTIDYVLILMRFLRIKNNKKEIYETGIGWSYRARRKRND